MTELILLPAVDVVEGRAVRLVQGKAGSETEYGSALEAALTWQRDGAEWIHLVDLDAAFGRGSNAELLAEVVRALDVKVELSGGIRDDASLRAALATGCELVVLGTHGRRGVDRLLLGSDAEQLARIAPVPVMLVRQPQSVIVTATPGQGGTPA